MPDARDPNAGNHTCRAKRDAGDDVVNAGVWVAAPAVLIVLLALGHWPGLDLPGRTPREALLFVGAPLLLGAAAWTCTRVPNRWLMGLLMLPLLAGILGFLNASDAERLVVFREGSVLVAPWLVALGAASLVTARNSPGQLFAALETGVIVALTVTGGLGLLQAWLGFEGVAQSEPPAATFVNRNVAAQAVVTMLPLAIPCLLRCRPTWKRWSGGLAVGMAVAFLCATRSRGAWMAIAVGLIVLIATVLPWRGRSLPLRQELAPGPTAVVLLLAGIALLVPNRGAAPPISVAQTLRTLRTATEGSGEVRLALWQNTGAILADAPLLGIGPGRFAVEYPRYQTARVPTPGFGLDRQPEHPHNDPLEYAAELGLPAALSLLAILIGGVVRSIRRSRRSGSTLESTRWVSTGLCLVAAVVLGMVSFPCHSPASAFTTWLCAGLAWGGDNRSIGAHRGLRRIILGAALAVAVAGAWVGAREIRSQHLLGRGMRAASGGRCEAALEDVTRLPDCAPWKRRDLGLSAMVHFYCDADDDRALRALNDASAVQPYQTNLLLAIGNRQLDAGQLDAARQAFDRAIEVDRTLPHTWLGLARLADARGQSLLARERCLEAIRRGPDFEPARVFCARYVP